MSWCLDTDTTTEITQINENIGEILVKQLKRSSLFERLSLDAKINRQMVDLRPFKAFTISSRGKIFWMVTGQLFQDSVFAQISAPCTWLQRGMCVKPFQAPCSGLRDETWPHLKPIPAILT
jgi:hypothetical protein